MEPEKRKDRFLFWGQGLLILGLALAALWCFWHLARGFILKLISFPFFVLLPGLMITRMILLLRSRRSVGAKVRRCAICAVLLICSLVFGMFSPYQIHRSTQENARERFAAVFHFFCFRIRRPTGRAYPTGRVYRKAAPMYTATPPHRAGASHRKAAPMYTAAEEEEAGNDMCSPTAGRKENIMGFAKYNEDDFECFVERLSGRGLNMRREWLDPAEKEEKEDVHEKRQ